MMWLLAPADHPATMSGEMVEMGGKKGGKDLTNAGAIEPLSGQPAPPPEAYWGAAALPFPPMGGKEFGKGMPGMEKGFFGKGMPGLEGGEVPGKQGRPNEKNPHSL